MTYFTDKELACKCCGVNGCKPEAVAMLNKLREIYGKPVILSSAYRCPSHNRKVGGASNSTHMAGYAFDIPCHGEQAYEILRAGILAGFTGIEVRQHLSDRHDRWIHFDCAPRDKWPRPNVF